MRKSLEVLLVLALTLSVTTPAQAKTHQRNVRPRNPGVTIGVAPSVVDYGDQVTVFGSIDPPAGGEQVIVKNGQGDTVASDDTDGSGMFLASFTPSRSMTVHAEWGADLSPGVDVGVRAVVDVKLQDVHLFGEALVTGSVTPINPSEPVDIKLLVGTRRTATVQTNLDIDGSFKTKISVDEPGTYTAVASFEDADHLKGTATSAKRTTPLPTLHEGAEGIAVQLLERRLVSLQYHLTGINQHFDDRTGDAVMAFRKVNGMQRSSTVDDAVWRALASPRTPKPESNMHRFHFEVDLSRQVMYTFEAEQVTNILHVSTGKPTTPTPPGHYRIIFKRPGMNASGMYYSAYFLEHFAIHGYADVPAYNASHGCVRVPFWDAKWVFKLAKIHTPIWIYP